MARFQAAILAVLAIVSASHAHAAQAWREGRHYTLLSPAQHTSVPAGKVEVMEVFSYGCPGCNGFQSAVEKLERTLPPNAQIVFLPASFRSDESFPMFQQAYFAAQSLGIAERTHQAMFDAVWKTGELAVSDPVTHRLKRPQPSIEDAARCYERLTGVKQEQFIAAAKSFGVEMKMKTADAQIRAMQVPSTPCIVVNGKYRVDLDSVATTDEFVDLVRYLVARESTPASITPQR
jgi:thiol:disulfide interchange protein DsbA